MTTSYSVLVTGATGNQGGAVVKALLNEGHQVRALTRNPQSPAATKLAAQGVEVVKGDFDDPQSLAAALTGIDTFYIMGSPMEVGVEGETLQGIALANAAKTANVGHLIYGSVANADKNTGIPHFDSKYRVEQHIRSLGLPFTISAPVFFMDNVIAPWAIDSLKSGAIAQALPGDRMLQQISVESIGRFVAALVSRREAVFGMRFDIADDELTGHNMANVISKTAGRQIQYQGFPAAVLKEQSEDMAAMFEWFDKVGYSTDIQALHQQFPEVNWQNYGQWVDAQDWTFLNQSQSA